MPRASWLWAALLSCPLLAADGPVQAFAGSASCAGCHKAESAHHGATAMANALETPARSPILASHSKLQFQEGRYQFTIAREGDVSKYTVTDGKDTLSVPIAWAFGQGGAGQTYVFERDGVYYESRVSFYRKLNGLDLTMGAAGIKPRTLEEAAGRQMSPLEAGECFGCHSTGGVSKRKLTIGVMIPGIQCEQCHGAAQPHIAAIKLGDAAGAKMKKMSALSAEEMSDFCGACHRTWEQISVGGPHGVLNVRFQPYRMTNSKCYDSADARIRCVSCHNPHEPTVTVARTYDAKCLACHATGAHAKGKMCPVAKADCVTCHMPKVELPGSHHQFTDHQIRIAKANGAYPD